jgi:hypothetical protein
MKPELFTRAVRKQAELYHRIINVIGGQRERGWSRRWAVNPRIALEEVMEDLEYGRD